jgi:hypothetical protein
VQRCVRRAVPHGWQAPIASALVIASAILPAAAHHARPEYDSRIQVSIGGTLMEFRMVNPHAWIEISVERSGGEAEEWSFEGDSVARLVRAGWAPEMLRPGESVTVLYNPRRDGGPGGIFQGITTEDGRFYSARRGRLNLRFGGGSR